MPETIWAPMLVAIFSGAMSLLALYFTNKHNQKLANSDKRHQDELNKANHQHEKELEGLKNNLTKGLEAMKQKHDTELENLRNSLQIQKDEKAAIRDYKYEALKRLYQEFEPLLFQLIEYSEHAVFRIKKLARSAREGQLRKDGGWLSGQDYFSASTIYRLLLPLAVFKLMQRKLTMFDLDLVPKYRAQYLLAKSLYFTFSDDSDLKADLNYIPQPLPGWTKQKWMSMRKTQPEVHRRQGMPAGVTDKIAEGLIISESRSNETLERVKSFGEFEQEYLDYGDDKISPNMRSFARAAELFKNFHPSSKPILWRILIAQVHIYKAMKKIRDPPKTGTDFRTLEMMSKDERQQYDWRQPNEEVTDIEVFETPFDAVQKYLLSRDNLKEFLAIKNNGTPNTSLGD